MPSFDFVSDVDLQIIDNAVNQVAREISQRFDFRGGNSEVEFKRQEKKIHVVADDEYKLRAIRQLLEQKMAKGNIDLRCLVFNQEVAGSRGLLKQNIDLKEGLAKEESKQIAKIIKDAKLKIQTQVQDNQIRVSGKKIDDLQRVIELVKEAKLPFPVQAINMRS